MLYTLDLTKFAPTLLLEATLTPREPNELARLPVGKCYVGVMSHYNARVTEIDKIRGGWVPVTVKKLGKPPIQLLCPRDTLFGRNHVQTRIKDLILIKGLVGIPVAPETSGMTIEVRSLDECLITIIEGASFVVQHEGVEHNLRITLDGQLKDGNSMTDVEKAVDVWIRSCVSVQVMDTHATFVWALRNTMVRMLPQWGAKVFDMLPIKPWDAVCLPLSNRTHRSDEAPQWEEQLSTFADYYHDTGINGQYAVGSMPASRLMMRCIYEAVYADYCIGTDTKMPASDSINWTLNALLY